MSERESSAAIDAEQACPIKRRRQDLQSKSRFQTGSGSGYKPPALVFQPTNLGTETTHNYGKKYVTRRTTFEIKHNFHDQLNLLLVGPELDELFKTMVSPLITDVAADDRVSIEVEHPELTKPLYLNPRRKQELNYADFCDRIFQISQSNSMFTLDGKLNVTVRVLKNTRGGIKTVDEDHLSSKSVIQIHSESHECGHKAICLGLFRITHDIKGSDVSEWKNLCKAKRAGLKNKTKDLCQAAGTNYNEMMTLDDLPKYLSYFNSQNLDVQIVVYKRDKDQARKDSIFWFKTKWAKLKIFLEYIDDETEPHFNLITSIQGYLRVNSAREFCEECLNSVRRKSEHCCLDGCKACGRRPPCDQSLATIGCEGCEKDFFGETCYQTHVESKKCGKRMKCSKCLVEFLVRNGHKCLESQCHDCGKWYKDPPHYCFIPTLDKAKLQKEDEKNKILVFFDIESQFVERDGVKVHLANLLVSLTVCDHCYIAENVSQSIDGSPAPLKEGDCQTCGSFKHVFSGLDCVKRFGDYLYTEVNGRATRNKIKVKVFAHNFKSYDGRFILQDLFSRQYNEDPKIIMTGCKILKIDIDNIRFQDSMSLLPAALKVFPTAFGFAERVKKGFFPFLFNVPENESLQYPIPLPPKRDYGYETMKPDAQKEFDEWYNVASVEQDFDLKRDIESYCTDDVMILMISVQKFRQGVKAITDLDPITRKFTSPSIAMETFKSGLMAENTIGVTPIKPYGDWYTPDPKKSRRSKISICYFSWLEWKLGRFLVYEKKMGKVYVDCYDEQTKTIYEFLGCLFHGCKKCYNIQDVVLPIVNKSGEQLNAELDERVSYFQHLKETLIPELKWELIWECEVDEQKRTDGHLRLMMEERVAIYRKIESVGNINMRDTYLGGRTNNRMFVVDLQPGEGSCEYRDFVSLYPSVLYDNLYPADHPRVLHGVDYSPYRHFGFVKCKILPPQRLMFPILPLRVNGKLIFPLCLKCTLTNATDFCNHSDDERCLVGSFCTAELKVAVEKYGYKVIETYEIIDYPLKYSGMFKKYITLFIKEKIVASGFPTSVTTEERKDLYVKYLTEKLGTEVKKEDIQTNPVKRMIAKLMLNSFYGKFGERPNQPQTVLVRDYATLWDLVTREDINILSEVNVSDNRTLISYNKKNEEDCSPGQSSVAIASFCTSYGRLKLFEKLDEIYNDGNEPVYWDTDSIFYIRKPGTKEQPTGEWLGEMTDELNGNKCSRAVFLGPKNYGYQLDKIDGSSKTVVKVKGICLTANALEIITLPKMKEMAVNYYTRQPEPLMLTVNQQQIIAKNRQQELITREFVKNYRALSEKRMIFENDSYPFGFVL